MSNRISNSDFEENLRAKVVNTTIVDENTHSRIFYFAQVVSNKDPKNINRIKVRIPVIDQIHYGGTKEEGDAKLSWCLPVSNRFLNIPEVNSIIVVAILDPKIPHFGRLYFDNVTGFSTEDIFKNLTPQSTLSNFNIIEDALNIKISGKPKEKEFNGKENIEYPVGLRGKGKNKFVLDKESSLWEQNKSFIKLTNDLMELQSDNNINIFSSKGEETKYNPLFHSPVYTYLSDVNKMIQKIVVLLNGVPALSKSGPCLPSPSAPQLISSLKLLSTKLAQLRKDGHSKKIKIN